MRRLIVCLCLLSVLMALAASFYASYRVQRDILLANTLHSNAVYSQKLAQGTEIVLATMRKQLAYSAGELARAAELAERGRAETARLLQQSDHFNAVLVIDAAGVVQASAPASLGLAGEVLDTPVTRDALASRRAFTSSPFQGVTGRWLITLVHPIIDAEGRFLGYVSGAIYLHSENALHQLLTPAAEENGAYMYAVDASGTIIYHPRRQRVGSDASTNPIVRSAMRGQAGVMRAFNIEGVDMLAGYSAVPSTGWGIVSQRPAELTLRAVTSLFWRTVFNTLPLLLLSLACIWWFARSISRPLSELADAAGAMDRQDVSQRMRGVSAWYVEAAQLKRALLSVAGKIRDRIARLRRESTTDILTGLLNRRGMEEAGETLRAERLATSVIVLDIDHFKAVNDTHGHAVGDAELRALASCMRANSRPADILVRPGGEEFLILMPGAGLRDAAAAAERLRLAVERAVIEPGGPITISLGVAHAPDVDIGAAAQQADEALYQAKRAGRNQSWLAEPPDAVRPLSPI